MHGQYVYYLTVFLVIALAVFVLDCLPLACGYEPLCWPRSESEDCLKEFLLGKS
jgi:hypothetical protein